MSTDIMIRQYEPRDKNAVWRVHDRSFRASSIRFIPNLDRYLRRIPQTFLDVDGEFFVGTLDTEESDVNDPDSESERIVAIGGFQPKNSTTIEMKSIRVDPDYQRNGYGRTVVEALEARACEYEYERVVLSTSEALTAAQRLYEGLGYERTGREWLEEPGFDLIYFEKRLCESE